MAVARAKKMKESVMMDSEIIHFYPVLGSKNGQRVDSRMLEEKIQKAVSEGHCLLEVDARGQHGIGGRLWQAGDEKIYLRIKGYPGQRVGSMGFPNTQIEILGTASDDVGWLNAGAEIIVHGHATNGVGNAMAQGKIYVSGNVGARGMTMTKHNPRFDPPELWVLGSVGDYFAEFMAGGIAVICGYQAQDRENVLGYRPCVGMVGGKIFFRGPHKGFSQVDARLFPIHDEDWQWLMENLQIFLEKIQRPDLFRELTRRGQWRLLVARSPLERIPSLKKSMSSFRKEVWDGELGEGGLIGDLTDLDLSPIPLITTGDLRRFVPVWENRKYIPPCEASCPTGIPVHERWRLIREGRMDEAVNMAMAYTPFPATICGYLCPNLCMQGCTRQTLHMKPLDVSQVGRASIETQLPELPALTGKQIAVVGGGPAGISLAWQLRQQGHKTVIYEMGKQLGGKISSVIPKSRLFEEVFSKELERIEKALPCVHLQYRINRDDLQKLKKDYDFVVIAVGSHRPLTLNVPGKERIIPALDFLYKSKMDQVQVGRRVVIIGAGNVGCDAAVEAHRLGTEEITLIDIQKPASFGKEKEAAEAVGSTFRWPCFTRAVTGDGVELTTGEIIPADTVIAAIGDRPDLDFLPETIDRDNGFISVNEYFQTSDPRIFAIGDSVRLGLLTDAIGAGRKVARVIGDMLADTHPHGGIRQMIDVSRVKLEYFDPRKILFDNVNQCASECASCGVCRDCGVCESICPQTAISRRESNNGSFEMAVDPERCIGCGFCVGACPCGVWTLIGNDALE